MDDPLAVLDDVETVAAETFEMVVDFGEDHFDGHIATILHPLHRGLIVDFAEGVDVVFEAMGVFQHLLFTPESELAQVLSIERMLPHPEKHQLEAQQHFAVTFALVLADEDARQLDANQWQFHFRDVEFSHHRQIVL
jgi:hypothetical protein